MMTRAEIDTTAPFQSVKEAVLLFGEKILACQVYACRLNQVQVEEGGNGNGVSRSGSIATELGKTKQSLEKAREESMAMADNVIHLEEELEITRQELQQLKKLESVKQSLPDIETKFEVEITSDEEKGISDKKHDNFTNLAPSEEIVLPRGVDRLDGRSWLMKEEKRMKMKKKKTLMPFITGIFSKKKGGQEAV